MFLLVVAFVLLAKLIYSFFFSSSLYFHARSSLSSHYTRHPLSFLTTLTPRTSRRLFSHSSPTVLAPHADVSLFLQSSYTLILSVVILSLSSSLSFSSLIFRPRQDAKYGAARTVVPHAQPGLSEVSVSMLMIWTYWRTCFRRLDTVRQRTGPPESRLFLAWTARSYAPMCVHGCLCVSSTRPSVRAIIWVEKSAESPPLSLPPHRHNLITADKFDALTVPQPNPPAPPQVVSLWTASVSRTLWQQHLSPCGPSSYRYLATASLM